MDVLAYRTWRSGEERRSDTHSLGPGIYRMEVLRDARNPRWTGMELELSPGQGCEHTGDPQARHRGC